MMKKWSLILLVFLAWGACAEPVPLGRNQLYLPGCATFAENVYTVTLAEKKGIANTTTGIVWNVPVEKCAGRTIAITAELRSDTISSDADSNHWGGKIQGAVFLKNGKISWRISPAIRGTNDWKKYTIHLNIPKDGVKNAAVTFGLQQAWGTLQIRNITVNGL